jgi:hypothetical protein
MRIAWDSVGRIVALVVSERLDERRLDGLIAIGVDEIGYRRHHRYLTSVVDHKAGAIVWCSPGRNAETLQAFFDELGPERTKSIRAVSIDMSGGYEKAIVENAPHAEVCFDPFHVVRLGQRGRPGPPRRVERARTLAHQDRQMDQRHPLVAAQEPREADDRTARAAARGPTSQPAALPRLPAQRRTPRPLPARGPSPRPGAPRRVARLGDPIAARPIHQDRAHDPPPPQRDPQAASASTQPTP